MIRRFRLLHGCHEGNDPNYVQTDPDKPNYNPTGRHLYRKGDIIETEQDLRTLNFPNLVPKFECLEPEARREETIQELEARLAQLKAEQTKAHQPTEDEQFVNYLNSLEVKDLRTYAASEKINLKGASTKEEIVKAIIGAENQLRSKFGDKAVATH